MDRLKKFVVPVTHSVVPTIGGTSIGYIECDTYPTIDHPKVDHEKILSDAVEGLTNHIDGQAFNSMILGGGGGRGGGKIEKSKDAQITAQGLIDIHAHILEEETPIRAIIVMDGAGECVELLNKINDAKGRTIVMPLHSYLQIRRDAGESDSVDMFNQIAGIPVSRHFPNKISLEQIKFEDESYHYIPEEKPKYTAGGKRKRRKF